MLKVLPIVIARLGMDVKDYAFEVLWLKAE
jgi:hypothetical protein